MVPIRGLAKVSLLVAPIRKQKNRRPGGRLFEGKEMDQRL
jgi:hypothetical protein